MSGYFFAASKPGGLTIQPWILQPVLRRVPHLFRLRELLAREHVVVDRGELVNVETAPVFGTENVTMSFGLVGVDRIPTASPFLPTLGDGQQLLAARHRAELTGRAS